MNPARRRALEPTGHYWFNLADYLRDYDVKLVLVAPQHVKHSKEMDDNTQTKNDRKDPLVIAKLVTGLSHEAKRRQSFFMDCPKCHRRVTFQNRVVVLR